MPFEIKKVLEHGTTKHIVARLSLQILEILKQCNVSKDIQDKLQRAAIAAMKRAQAAVDAIVRT